MILLGAGLGRIPGESWESLEPWQTDETLSPTQIRFAVSGDFDGDGYDDLFVVLDGGEEHQDIWRLMGSASGLEEPDLVFRATRTNVDTQGEDDLCFIHEDPQTHPLVSSGSAGLLVGCPKKNYYIGVLEPQRRRKMG